MKTINTALIFLFSLSLSNSFASTHINNKKQLLIDTLLLQNNASSIHVSDRLSKSYLQQINAILKQSNPNLGQEKIDAIQRKVKQTIHQHLVVKQQFSTLISPIYDQNFSVVELTMMIEFNKTDFGKKLLRVMPLISNEAAYIYEELELDLAPEINEQVLDIIKTE
jgi:hypothetical protein